MQENNFIHAATLGIPLEGLGVVPRDLYAETARTPTSDRSVLVIHAVDGPCAERLDVPPTPRQFTLAQMHA